MEENGWWWLWLWLWMTRKEKMLIGAVGEDDGLRVMRAWLMMTPADGLGLVCAPT
jgi:hypothetical protein